MLTPSQQAGTFSGALHWATKGIRSMNVSWKFLGYAAGLALVGAVGACTVTTNSGDDDGGYVIDDDSGTSDTGTTDSGTPDTGFTPGAACADVTFPDGGTTTDFSPVGTGACLECTQASCCAQMGACFQDTSGDCQSLEYDCLEPCVAADPNDAGGCANDCASLHPDSVNAHTGWSDCQNTNCAAQCQ
jgi:hypothetical protein